MRLRSGYAAALAGAFLVIVLGVVLSNQAAGQSLEGPAGQVCLEAEEDARCGSLAVSGSGDATCDSLVLACLAASGSGDAEARCSSVCVPVAPQGDATGEYPVSIWGGCREDRYEPYHSCIDAEIGRDADGHYAGVSGDGDSRGRWAAVSASGDARSGDCVDAYLEFRCGVANVAISGTGNATGPVPVSATGGCRNHVTEEARPCVAAHPDRDADGHYAGISGSGDASGCVAASAEGHAESDCYPLLAVGDRDCEPHPPIRITQRVGERGFEWINPVTGERELRPGSGVVHGEGTAEDPYVIEGWCIQAPSQVPHEALDAFLAGIMLYETDAHVRIQGNYIVGVPEARETRGILAHGVTNVTIAGNEVANHRQGVLVRGDSQGVPIVDNEVREGYRAGIRVRNSDGSLVADNRVRETFGAGIDVSGFGEDNVVRGNLVENGVTFGIVMSTLKGETAVHDNVLRHNYYGMMTVDDASAAVHHNRVVDNDRGGIFAFGTAERVHNNTVRDNGARGLMVGFISNGTVVEHNRIEGHRKAGVTVEKIFNRQVPNTTVTANEITDNRVGVLTASANGLALQGNNIWANDELGLDVSANSVDVNATHNWWGCPEGPTSPSCDGVSGKAVLEPWLEEPNPEAGPIRTR